MTTDTQALGIGRARRYVPELEAVRGIAVALVVAMHVDAYVGGPTSPEMSVLRLAVRHPRLGVDVFFVLSAFLLSGPILAAAVGGRPIDAVEFAKRRALRILPLYWVAVVVATLVKARTAQDLLHALPYFVFLNALPNGAVALPPHSGVWWSLATEAQFYALLALAALAMRRRLGPLGIAVGLCAYLAAYVSYVSGFWSARTIPGTYALQASVFGRGPLFLAGIATAELHRRFGDRLRSGLRARRFMAAFGADAIAMLVGGLLFAHVAHVGILPGQGIDSPQAQGHDVVDATLLGVLLLWLMVAPLRLRPLVVNAVFARLGILSYSIYLFHEPLLTWFVGVSLRIVPGLQRGWGWRQFLLLAAYSTLLLALAQLTFRFIEQPFLRRKARM